MSVDNPEVIDFIGVERTTGSVVLTISDHLDWSHEATHIELLQEKLNGYMRFIESGEIRETYPDSVGRPVVISIVGSHPLSSMAEEFLQHARSRVGELGVELRFEIK
ncbi:MAG: hypothetical protein HYV09_13045 [Deltaproteobacteria bacterium]|nr:hypothetical protein [Deltaproteobacteria bacterium]